MPTGPSSPSRGQELMGKAFYPLSPSREFCLTTRKCYSSLRNEDQWPVLVAMWQVGGVNV